MSDVKQQLDRRAITMIGVLRLVRAIETEIELVERESIPTFSFHYRGPLLISMHAFTGLAKAVNALHFIY